MNTAVTYAQNIRSGVGVTKTSAAPAPAPGIESAKIVINNNNIKPISLLRINNNNKPIVGSILANNIKNSNGTTTTAAAVAASPLRKIITPITTAVRPVVGGAGTATVGGVTVGGKITAIPIPRKVVLENNLSNMPKKLNNTITGKCFAQKLSN